MKMKYNIQRFSDRLTFNGTVDYTMFGTAEPPANFRPIKVGDDLSGKEIMIVFGNRFRYALENSLSDSEINNDWGYKIALDETTFGISDNTLFLQPESLISYDATKVTSLALVKTANHSINAISAPNTTKFASIWNESTSSMVYSQSAGVMDNIHYIVARREVLPSDFGVITELAPRGWASNIFVKEDNLKIGNQEIEGLRIDNKDVAEISKDGNISYYKENFQLPTFGQAPKNQWLHIDYPNTKLDFTDAQMSGYIEPLVSFTNSNSNVAFYTLGLSREDNDYTKMRYMTTISIIGEGRHGPNDEITTLYQCDVLGTSQGWDETTGKEIVVKEGNPMEYVRFTDVLIDEDAEGKILKVVPRKGVTPQLDSFRTITKEYDLVPLQKTDNLAEGLILMCDFPDNIDKTLYPSLDTDTVKTLFSVEATYTVTPTDEYDDGTRYYNYGLNAQILGTYNPDTNTTTAPYEFTIGDLYQQYGQIIFVKEYGASSVKTKVPMYVTNNVSGLSAPLTNLDTSSPLYPYIKKVVWKN